MVRLSDSNFSLAIILPIIFLEVALTGYPILSSLYTSLTNATPMGATFIGLDNYAKALQDPAITQAISVSILFVLITVMLCIPMSLGLALLLNENFPGKRIVKSLVLLPWATSEFASGVIWSVMLNSSYGVFNGLLYSLRLIDKYRAWITHDTALFVVSTAYIWHLAPFGAFLILASLESIPQEVYQQARVDGAGVFRRFRYITLPHLRYVLLIVLILITMQSFSAFDIIYALTTGGPGRATTSLTWEAYTTQYNQMRYGYAAAISYILLAIVLFIAVIYFVILTRRK
jgi:ABC-type sugar transport system permease subunit